MKCIKSIRPKLFNGTFHPDIVRCSNEKADALVNSGEWDYVPKKAWKRYGKKYLGRRRHDR